MNHAILTKKQVKKVLFFKAWQKSRQNPFYWDLVLKLDKSSTQAVSIDNYEIRLFIFDYTHIPMYLSSCRKRPSSSFSLKKLLRLHAKSFVTKEFPDLHYWWSEELCSQHLLQVVGVSHIMGSMHHWLVSYRDSCIERKDCHYNTSSIRYWGKGSTC